MVLWRRGMAVTAVTVATLGAAALAAAAIEVTVTGPATAPQAAGSSAGACAPAGAHTVAADREVRAYSLMGTGTSPFGPDRRLYACLKRTGRTVALGSLTGRQRVTVGALTGHMLALARQSMGVDTLSTTVEVLDVASGRALHQRAATGPVGRPESAVVVYRMEVDAHANVAWLSSQSSIVGPRARRYEVHRDNGAGDALLDAGPSIIPGSLHRRGEVVTWLDSSARRSARLD